MQPQGVRLFAALGALFVWWLAAADAYQSHELLLRMLERKKYEIQQLEDTHQGMTDPLQLRLGFVADECKYKLSRALRLYKIGDTRKMSVLADMKRLSPTSPDLAREVSVFGDAAMRSEELFDQGANAVMVNTDEMGWGGAMGDLHAVAKARRRFAGSSGAQAARSLHGSNVGPPAKTAVVMKDLVLHPIQIAEALEAGADGVLLIASVVGQNLDVLMDAATIMGTEAIVEVHTPNECLHAIDCGATIIMVNNWDRADGKWHPKQAEAVRPLIPDHVVTIATGGIGSSEQAAELADAGFDCVALGRALAAHPKPRNLIKNIKAIEADATIMGWNGPHNQQ